MLAERRGPINCGRAVAPGKLEMYDVERHISASHKVAVQRPEIIERLLVRIKTLCFAIYRAACRSAGDPALAVTLWTQPFTTRSNPSYPA